MKYFLMALTLAGCTCSFDLAGQSPFGDSHPIMLAPNGHIRGAWPMDVDADGSTDLLTVNAADLGWYRNKGNGSYEALRILHPTNGAVLARFNDLDGDGTKDVVVTCDGDTSVSWFRGLSGGQFAPLVQLFQLSALPTRFDIGDLDGDLDQDIALARMASSSGTNVTWWKNNGMVFQLQPVAYNAGPPWNYRGFFLEDNDLDGDLDMILVTLDRVARLTNNGGGSFGGLVNLTPDLNALANAAAFTDLDGDGDLDILAATPTELRSFMNNGSTLHATGPILLAGQTDIRQVLVQDITGSPEPEVIVHDVINGQTSLRIGILSSGPALSLLTTLNMKGTGTTEPFDADGDGDLDVIYTSPVHGGYFRQTGPGVFAPWPVDATRLISWPFHLTTGDINNDGSPDVVVTELSRFSYFLNDGTPNFGPGQPPVSVPTGVEFVVANDDNADGHAEVFVGTGNNILRFNNTQNGFDAGTQLLFAPLATSPDHLGLEDMDDNGSLDLLYAYNWSDQVGVLYSLGAGQYSQVVSGNQVLDNPTLVFGADLDGDGYKDLVRNVSSSISDIQWHPNNTIGGFPPQSPTGTVLPSTDDLIGGFAVGHVNNDGYPDVVASVNNGTDRVIAYLNNWNGTLWTPVELDDGIAVDDLLIEDLNGDGFNDIIGLKYESSGPWVWMAYADGLFDPGVQLASPISELYAIHLADLDGDGDPDLLASGSSPLGLFWYENESSISTSTHPFKGDGLDGISLVPNPTTGQVALAASCGELTFDEVVVLSSDGRRMPLRSLVGRTSEVLDLAHLAPGTYHVLLLSNGSVVGRESLVLLKE